MFSGGLVDLPVYIKGVGLSGPGFSDLYGLSRFGIFDVGDFAFTQIVSADSVVDARCEKQQITGRVAKGDRGPARGAADILCDRSAPPVFLPCCPPRACAPQAAFWLWSKRFWPLSAGGPAALENALIFERIDNNSDN